MAADKGDCQAQFQIGVLYYDALGGEADHVSYHLMLEPDLYQPLINLVKSFLLNKHTIMHK